MDLWIVPAWSLKTRRCTGSDSWIVPAWSLKNKEVFRIGLVDRDHVEPSKRGAVPDWTCGMSTRDPTRSSDLWSLEIEVLFLIGLLDRQRVGGV